MEIDLPFKIQYAGTELVRMHCYQCKVTFRPDELVMAEMIQSKLHDGKDPVWYHSKCFFASHQITQTNRIENFENIRYDDQLQIFSRIDPKSAEKLEKIARINKTEQEFSHKKFGVEYANTDKDKCATCQERIERNELRIKSVVNDSAIAAKFGKEILWAHLHCFVLNRQEYNYLWDGKLLEGYGKLQEGHQAFIAECLPGILKAEIEEKVTKSQKELNTVEENLEVKIARQTSELVRVRQALHKYCNKENLQLLLIMNDCDFENGDIELLLDRCADILTFGSLYKCQKCLRGDMIFSKYGYTCNAWINEWIKCGNFEQKPLRMKCFIPDELRKNGFFATCEPKAEDRAVRAIVVDDTPMQITTQVKNTQIQNATVAKLQLKDGTAVDPKSNLHLIAHVYHDNSALYNCVLGLTDIQKNKNSYYKLQVLESDSVAAYGVITLTNYWLFTSWGRTGTDIGSSKVQQFQSPNLAVQEFEKIYEEQTGNNWKSRQNFRRIPGKFYPIDVNYNDDIEVNTKIASRLNPQVKELMKLLFNIPNMQVTMKEYELDLQKMPLGKLSIKQLEDSYLALAELEFAIQNGSSRNELIGLSNKFFTLIPHNFGLDSAPVLDSISKINKKREMIDSLFDIEDAYAMMSQVPNIPMNSFDGYYKQLNAEVEHLDPNSEEFNLIKTYFHNTSVHGYRLTILEVFKVQRHGEEERFASFKNFPNRQLLWHGSRTINFASIIKNGLRITQQVHGSMFGRGVYFADMVSKSVGYADNLLTLCEVALGTVHEAYQSQNFTAPPPNHHSVKGVGQTQPNMQQAHTTRDGVLVPLGKPMNVNSQQQQGRYPTLAYNEYIVYNEAQIKLQYLIKYKNG